MWFVYVCLLLLCYGSSGSFTARRKRCRLECLIFGLGGYKGVRGGKREA